MPTLRRFHFALPVASAITMLVTLSGCSKSESELPLHFFLADSAKRDVAVCEFSRHFDPQDMFRIWDKPLQPCAINYGWTPPSVVGITAFGKRSFLRVFADAADYDLLILRVRAYPNPDPRLKQEIRVSLNGRRIGLQEIPHRWTTIGIEIPDRLLRLRSNKIAFAFSYHTPPNTLGSKGKKDHRRFAAELSGLALARSNGGRLSERDMERILARGKDPSTPPVRVFNRTTGMYRVKTPGTLVLPMEISPSSDHLAIEMSAPSDLDLSRTVLSARVVDLDSGDEWTPSLPDWQPRKNESGLVASGTVPIRRCAGGPCALILEVRPEPAGTVVEIARIREVAGNKDQAQKTVATKQAENGDDSRPDIVLITLDAARADRFSCYGYDRHTTPNIDRFARESLVFTNAHALAPYTLASVPTMVTGRSFLAHGVSRRGRKLTPENTTRAEQLRDAGYRTICCSTNPHNSRASGTGQGYDEFYELWTEKEGRAAADPQFITERALETLARWDDSQPLHLQLHYMPPHAPYNPAPEFDVYSDPEYDGPCDGRHQTIRALDGGRRAPGDGCLEQLIAKYDGGLFEVDHWVGSVLEALRARERWKDTVVLVTADHGDAFLEHGRTGHNTTVFDEMLRVPFILRLPEDDPPRNFTSDRLVTLEDIVPTLLASASLEPAAGVTGIDLSRTASDGEPPARYFISRTAHYSPTYALRTPRWKIILPTTGHGLLFDLANYPEERRNLSFRRWPVFVALGQLLTWKLNSSSVPDIQAPTSEIPEQNRDMLETLGYVEQ